jgi:hypothetical protein
MIITARYLCVALLVLNCACAGTLVERKAEVSLVKNRFFAPSTSKIRVAVPSSSGAVVPGSNPGFLVSGSPERILSELAVLEFRGRLLKTGNYQLLSHPMHGVEYTIKLACSELVPDVSESGDKAKIPTQEAGTLLSTVAAIAATSSAALPGIGALVQNFQPLSGLALSENKKERVGTVTIDVQILDSKGYLLDSQAYPSTFAVRVVDVGGGASFSEYRDVAASKAQDAVRVSVEQSVKRFLEISK